jgi:hypothetical protein
MQVFYAIPFMLLSLLAFEACVAAPRWRGFRYQALVAPVAFGFSSIFGMGVVILTADRLNLALFTRPWSGVREVVSLILIYFIPGLLGGWGAVAAVAKITTRLTKSGVMIEDNRRDAWVGPSSDLRGLQREP